MHEDHKGFMWFGTWDGLNRFDGYNFTHYKSRPGDSCQLSHNRIDEIKEDRFGCLWLKTYDEKIHRFNRRKEIFQGIPHDTKKFSALNIRISSIYETCNGEMWLIAKNIGCFRVITDSTDLSFKIMHYSSNFDDRFLLINNNINFIFEDSRKFLWVGTEEGLQCLSGKNPKEINIALKKFNKYNYTSVVECEDKLWFGTSDGDLIQYDSKTRKFISFKIGERPYITRLLRLPQEDILIGTRENGLILLNYKTKQTKHFTKEEFPALGNNCIRSLYLDKHNIVWIETESFGVVRFKPESNNFKKFNLKTDQVNPLVYSGNFFKLTEDCNGILWINLRGGGFCYYNRAADEVEYFYNKPASPERLFSNLVTAFHTDSRGNLWLSTHSRGIENVCFQQNKFTLNRLSNEPSSLSANNVRAIFEDSYKNLWVGTKYGKLYCFDRNRKLKKVFSRQTKAAGEISFDGMVYTIVQDKNGALWFGTKGDGIIKASFTGNPDQYKFHTVHYKNNPLDPFSLSSNFVYTICEDKYGGIWIGTFGGGINYLEQKGDKIQFRNFINSPYNFPAGSYSKIRNFRMDATGKIWAGSTNGLIIFKPIKASPDSIRFFQYRKTAGDYHSLPSNDVHYIHKDKANNIWVGTFGGGLSKVINLTEEVDNPKFKTYNTTNDLPVDIVLSIQEDRKGNLWVATEGGISMFNVKQEKFINFSDLDGLKKSTFSESCCETGNNGELYFGCSEGYYSFFPDSIAVDNSASPLELTNLQLFNKNIKIGEPGSPLKEALSELKSITLNHKQSVFSIEYAGLDFKHQEKLEYAFMLEGFEREWNHVGTQRKATYTNLAPGTYLFKVKCAVNGLFDKDPGRELQIIILPPWWKTIYAYIAYLIIILAIGLFIRKISLNIIHLKNKITVDQMLTDLKLKFFTNISHELRTPLTLIISPAEELLKAENLDSGTKESLGLINKNARRMLRHINQLLDFRKMQTGKMRLKVTEAEIVSFVKDIVSGFHELAIHRKIDFRFSSNTDKLLAWIDMEKIDTVIFNLLSNAFKFTPEGKAIEVIINSLVNSQYFEIIIKDQGIGISPEEMPRLFEPFAISHNPNDQRAKGTGIGLSLVKEIVDHHKGSIIVNSKLGEGSTFIVRLQSGKGHFLDSEVAFDAHQDHASVIRDMANDEINNIVKPVLYKTHPIKENTPLILIVEDNVDLRTYLSGKLIEFYNIEEAIDGREGFQKAENRLPDLIISDIMMPHMDGIELTDKLRNNFKTSHIPIILLTAKSSVESMIEGIKYGADAYITKPFHIDFLLARIANLLEQRKRLIDKFNLPVKVIDLSPNEIIVTSKDEQFLKDVIRIIEENLSNPEFNIEMIASNVGLGRTTFFKKLKSLTDMAPVEFLRDMRVTRGYQLLRTNDFTISEVAYQVGFSDAGYFSKCFKEKYNQSPTEFLKSIKK